MAPKAEFGLLGPLLVRYGGSVVKIPAGKQRVLLAALLLSPNQAVLVRELADALWSSSPPASARATLHNYVKRLRQALDRDGDSRIITVRGGYMIKLEASELDLAKFETAQASAAQAALQGAWELVASQLRDGLSLWRGQPLADVQSEMLARREVPRLVEMRLQAVEACIDADLRLGRHAGVIAELRQLADMYPMRERLHAQLMLALYRDGQQAEALATYQRARRVLIDELGTEPGPGLRRLEREILVADPALEGPAATPQRAVTTAAGSGQALSGWHVPRQLPVPAYHFAGRATELDALTALLGEGSGDAPETVVISAVVGTAGVGKTALAVHWAHQIADRFPDGQLYVNLHGFGPSGTPVTPADAILGVLNALRVPMEEIPRDSDGRRDLYHSLVAGRRMLILLDNARDAEQVRPLLPNGRRCLVVVTSRSQLASLVALEGAHPLVLDVLSAADARELLAKRLGPERITAEPRAVDELTRLCARLPLALAIAAARAALRPRLPLADLVAEFQDAGARLDALDAGDALASARAAFSWSYQHLPAPAARMFRLLGLHPGPDISASAAASLAEVGLDEARQTLQQLTQASLLAEDAAGRFALHDLLRTYAAELASMADSAQQRQAAVHRMLDHYLHTARAAQLMLNPGHTPIAVDSPRPEVQPEQVVGYDQAMAWFEAEQPVLLGAVDEAVRAGLDTHAWLLPAALTTFLNWRGHWESYAAAMRTAVAAAQRLGTAQAQAVAYRYLGTAQRLRGCYQDAHAALGQALEFYQQLGDGFSRGRVHLELGMLLSRQSRYDEGIDHGVQALSLFQAAGNLGFQANTLNNIAYYHAQLGNYEQALTYSRQALTMLTELGFRREMAFAWDSIGFAHQHLGHHDEAVECYQRSLAISRELGQLLNQAEVLDHLGNARHEAGQPQAAREAWQQALEILDDLHHASADPLRDKLAHLAVEISIPGYALRQRAVPR